MLNIVQIPTANMGFRPHGHHQQCSPATSSVTATGNSLWNRKYLCYWN